MIPFRGQGATWFAAHTIPSSVKEGQYLNRNDPYRAWAVALMKQVQPPMLLVLGAVLLCACADPSRRADALARNLDFEKQIEMDQGF
jgi:hypothetical protein